MLSIAKNNFKNKKYFNKGKLKYSAQKYSNPFFVRKRGHATNHLQNFAVPKAIKYSILFVFVLLGIAAYFFLYSSYFNIKNIEVTGGEKIPNEKIKEIAWEQINNNFFILLPQKNIFIFSESRLAERLDDKYFFENKSIEKKLPDTIQISFEEKHYSFIWHENDKYYYADSNGHIISEANLLEITQKEYPLVSNISNDKINNNQIGVQQESLDFLTNLFSIIKKHNQDLKMERFLIDDEANTVKVDLEAGPRIYFNINEDIDKQINKLLIIKNERLKEDFANKIYIDVRIGDSVYYL